MAKLETKTKAESAETESPLKSTVKISVARLGAALKSHEFDSGTKLKDVREEIDAVSQEVRVNGEAVSDSYVLKDGDLITVVPEAVVGGN